MREQGKKPERAVRHFGFIILFTACFIALSASHGITSIIYKVTGQPPVILSHVFTGFTATFLLMFAFGIVLLIKRRLGHDGRNDFHGQLTKALEQISQGNFDVFLDTEDYHIEHSLAAAINNMAKNLGTLETMRQDFISNVSHEIQSPLTSIGGFASLLQKEDIPYEQRRRYGEIIEAESKRLSSLSENLLKLSSLDNKLPLNICTFRLDKQLETAALTLEPQWSAKNIEFEADMDKCDFTGDENLLFQCWINLLHNAIKFTNEGEKIKIELRAEKGNAVVAISDTGAGIAYEDQIHIFERFYKADKARDRSLGGNGLGLSLVRKIAELHKGQVAVKSTLGEGSVFTVTLPMLNNEEQ